MAEPIFIKKGKSIMQRKHKDKTFLFKLRSGHMECVSCVLQEGASTRPFSHKGEEIHIAIEGEIDYHVGDKVFHMRAGDILWHESKQKHSAVNVGLGTARYITVGTTLKFEP